MRSRFFHRRTPRRALAESLECRRLLSGSFSVSDAADVEGDDGTRDFVFTVTWNDPGPLQIAQVEYFTANGTADAGDYSGRSGVLSFSSGAPQQTVAVPVRGDTRLEKDETFHLNLRNPLNATIADGRGVGTIRNDEPTDLVIAGTEGDDVLDITAFTPDGGGYRLNGAPVVFDGATSVTFNAGGGNDLLIIQNPTFSLFAPVGGIRYHAGGQPGDRLENRNGRATRGVFTLPLTTPVPAPGWLRHGGSAPEPTQAIDFTGVASVVDSVNETRLETYASDESDVITLDRGADFFRIAYAGSTTLHLLPRPELFVSTGASVEGRADTVNVRYLPENTTTNISGARGDDTFNVGGPVGSLDPIRGALRILGGPGRDSLNLLDHGDIRPLIYSLRRDRLSRTTSPDFTWSALEQVTLNAGPGPNLVDVFETVTATHLNLGGGDDQVHFVASGTVPAPSLSGGAVDGGDGADRLVYGNYVSPISVHLGAAVPRLLAALSGAQAVPEQDVAAGGFANAGYNPPSRTIDINVHVQGMAPSQVTGLSLRRGVPGLDGPVLIEFDAAAIRPEGTGFTLGVRGVPLPAMHEAALFGGATYVAVSTDGAPAGLLRGQLLPTGPSFIPAGGTATGTSGVRNVENVTGGRGNDSLVGGDGRNEIDGGPGNDTIVAARGADVVTGFLGDDLLAWNDGDGSDVFDGGGGLNDLVLVNGSLASETGDALSVGAGANGRVNLLRSNLTPFALDVGTSESIVLNGLGGDDVFRVEDLAGVADLALLSLYGFDGADTFNVRPAPTVAVHVVGHDPRPPAMTGDSLFVSAAAATGAARIMSAGPSGFLGDYTFTDRRTVSFRQLESVRDDRPARRPEMVYLSGIAWTQLFRNEVIEEGLGSPTFGFRLDGGAAASGPLPWGNIDLVTVQFSGAGPEPRPEDLFVFGASGRQYRISAFTFEALTNTATWTLDRPLAAFSTATRPTAERAVLNFAGAPLRRVDVVPGDANRSGDVSPTDFGSVRTAVGRTSTDEGAAPRNYTLWRDVNGSGSVSPIDLGIVRAYGGASLAAFPQPAAALAPASMTDELFGTSSTP